MITWAIINYSRHKTHGGQVSEANACQFKARGSASDRLYAAVQDLGSADGVDRNVKFARPTNHSINN
jgi:hypothetical protein